MKLKLIFASTMTLVMNACGGSTSNPATVSKADLNPPKELMTVTQDGSVELRWSPFNAEDEFQGFQVFGAATSLETLYTLVKYPVKLSSAADLLNASIPQCEDNSAFFEAFGFEKNEEDCEDGEAEQEAAKSTTGTSLLEEDPDDLPPANRLACVGDDAKYTNTNVSVKIEGYALERQSCKVTEVWSVADKKKVAMANGTVYVFFVVAVKGDEFDEMSWSSNLTEDAPSFTAFSGSIELKHSGDTSGISDAVTDTQYVRFAVDGAKTIEKPTAAACLEDVCKLTGTNDQTTAGIYIGRDYGSRSQRLLISTPSSGKIELQPVGRATYGGDVGRLPGDEATTSYPTSKGAKFEVLGDQTFDLKITNADASIHYGKLYVTDVTYASATSTKSAATANVTIVIQPKTGSTYYAQ
jgi:hypothetical protein